MKFKKLVTVEEAKRILSEIEIRPEKEDLRITEAVNRIIAEDILAPIPLPPFTRASMDGYAVRSESTTGASEASPVYLRVTGSVSPGAIPDVRVGKGEAVEISTGAVMPEGADAVVMVEYTERDGDMVKIKRPAGKWENIMKEGSDISEGSLIFRKGTRLDGIKTGVLSGLGIERVKVWRLKVGLFSTGDEVIDISQTISPGKIYDINSYSLYSILRLIGADPTIIGNLPDEITILKERLLKESENYDMLITSGSTSAGRGDLLYRVIDEEGELLIHGVQIKPGKPFLAGIINGTPIIGLPGYPASALMTFHELVMPIIRKSMGEKWKGWKVRGRILRKIVSEGRRQLYPVFVVRDMIFPVDKGSGAITSLSEANGYFEIPEGEEVVDKGSEREVKLFTPSTGDILVAGEDVLHLVESDYIVKYVISSAEKTMGMMIGGEPDVAVIPSEFDDGFEDFIAGRVEVEWGWVGDGKVAEWRDDTALGMETGGSGDIIQHFQALYWVKKGKRCAMVRPFAERYGLDVDVEGKVQYSILVNPERRDVEEVRNYLDDLRSSGYLEQEK